MEKQQCHLRKDETHSLSEVVVNIPESNFRPQCRSRSRYIDRVPRFIRVAKPEEYTPSCVAIGPLHKPTGSSAENPLNEMEDTKIQYVSDFVKKTKKDLAEITLKIKEREEEISRYYYQENVAKQYGSDEFAKILLHDSCFIIMHFLQIYEQYSKEDDSTIEAPWGELDIWNDLMVNENQVPYCLIQEIYDIAGLNEDHISFKELTCFYFQMYNPQNLHHEDVGQPRQFVDLLRTFLLPMSFRSGLVAMTDHALEGVPSASDLFDMDITFEVSNNRSCMEIDFQDGVLRMGKFVIDAKTERYMRNIVALEQCSYPGNTYVRQYLTLLFCLVKTENDAKILVKSQIIYNSLGTDARIVEMLENLNLYPIVDKTNSQYLTLAKDLKVFVESRKNKYKSMFKREHWKLVGFILTLVASVYTLRSPC